MATDRAREQAFLKLMARQHGVATAKQAAELQLSRHRLRQLVNARYVRHVRPHLYVGLGLDDQFCRNSMAGTLLVAGSVASHRTALGLHLGKDWQGSVAERGRTHLSVPFGKHRSAAMNGLGVEAVIHRSRTLSGSDRCLVSGIPTTTPARTMFDLGGDLGFARSQLDVVLGEMLATRRVQPAALVSLLGGRLASHPGTGRLRSALELALQLGIRKTQSVPERQLLLLIAADEDLPRPTPQYRVFDGEGRFISRADAAIPEHRVAMEVDSRRWHSSAAAKARDAEKDRRLLAAGWKSLRFSPADLRRPGHVKGRIMRSIGSTHPLP